MRIIKRTHEGRQIARAKGVRMGRGRVKRRSPTIIEQFTVAARDTAWRIFRILYPKSNRIACFRKGGDFSHGLGRKPKLTPHQMKEARQRLAEGEPTRSLAKSYGVSISTISRLAVEH
jgi:DNA invertase Pin-like site-specific DNA recombinase